MMKKVILIDRAHWARDTSCLNVGMIIGICFRYENTVYLF